MSNLQNDKLQTKVESYEDGWSMILDRCEQEV